MWLLVVPHLTSSPSHLACLTHQFILLRYKMILDILREYMRVGIPHLITQEEQHHDKQEVDYALFQNGLHGNFLHSVFARFFQGLEVGRGQVGGLERALLYQLC